MLSEHDNSDRRIRLRDISPAIELICWAIVVLCPLLRLANGPAVTSDQFVFQVTLFSLALVGGTSLRIYRLVHPRNSEP